MHVKLNIIRY